MKKRVYKDFYWLNDDSRIFLSRGYIESEKPAEEWYWDIALNAERILGIDGFAKKFYSYLGRGFYSLSSPVISNFGNDKGLPVSCYNSYIPDNTTGIFDAIGEVGMMSKFGGGTSGYFGDLRPRGSNIGGIEGFFSDGPSRFMELFDRTADVISQGNQRRGSFAAYLPVEHPDIMEFLQIREDGHPIQDMSIGVTITDNWMESMISGDKEKRKVWGRIIRKRFETGFPYIFFTDTVNNNAPQVYKDLGRKVLGSNLCVTGDQRVVSSKGLLTAKELHEIGEELILYDNKESVKASPMQLIERNADVYKITLDNGMTHTVTKYHKVCVLDRREQKNNEKQVVYTKDVRCDELKIGDFVSVQTNKGLFGDKHMPKEAFLLGQYQGDGTQHGDSIHLCLWEQDFDLIDEISESFRYVCEKYKTQYADNNRVYPIAEFVDCSPGDSPVKKKVLASNALHKSLDFKKGVIPNWIWESDEETQWQYVRGLYYADGTVNVGESKGNPLQLSLASIDKEFLKQVQILLANLGMQTSIRMLRKAGENLLPNGKGGHSLYRTKDCWRLIISGKNDALEFNRKTRFLDRKNIVIEDRLYRDNTKKFYKVKSIEYVGKEDVYCCKVDSDRHHWICNGIVTHNCSEITLSSNEDESFVCVLSSINLLHWDEIVNTDAIETLIYFLDAVNEEFIQKTEGVRYMERAHNFAKRQRALGMGVLGWHSLLQSKMIPFESMESKILNNTIFKTIRERADKATCELAKTLGEPELLKGRGRRNVCTIAIAPTTSSSFILGQVSQGIEPLMSNYFIDRNAKGNFTYKNPYLEELLDEKGKNTPEVWRDILLKNGSVQHLSFLTQEEKDVFKTFDELSQKEIVIQAANRQRYIDQSQSLNLKIPNDANPKEVSDLLIEGWRMGIKTFYYQRGFNSSQELARSINSCVSCEG